MANKRIKILHLHSKETNADGTPKLPTSEQLGYGEIAINYASGVETIATKNENDEVVALPSRKDIEDVQNSISSLNSELKLTSDTLGYIVPVVNATENLAQSLSEDLYKEDGIVDHIINIESTMEHIDLGEYEYEHPTENMFVGYTVTPTDTYTINKPYSQTLTDSQVAFISFDDNPDASRMFEYCENVCRLDLNNFKTPYVTNMLRMFSGCSALESLDLKTFDTSNVTDMSHMFDGCSSLANVNVNNFNTSNVTNMNSMFKECNNLTNINVESFDTSNVTNMDYMFLRCTELQQIDLSSFNTQSIGVGSDMIDMFLGCNKLRYITLGPNFFATSKPIPFYQAPNLGINEAGLTNGWIDHLAYVAPEVAEGVTKTIQLNTNLQGKSWANTAISTLESKGYTIEFKYGI